MGYPLFNQARYSLELFIKKDLLFFAHVAASILKFPFIAWGRGGGRKLFYRIICTGCTNAFLIFVEQRSLTATEGSSECAGTLGSWGLAKVLGAAGIEGALHSGLPLNSVSSKGYPNPIEFTGKTVPIALKETKKLSITKICNLFIRPREDSNLPENYNELAKGKSAIDARHMDDWF